VGSSLETSEYECQHAQAAIGRYVPQNWRSLTTVSWEKMDSKALSVATLCGFERTQLVTHRGGWQGCLCGEIYGSYEVVLNGKMPRNEPIRIPKRRRKISWPGFFGIGIAA
jgi:hypothetical protein